MVQATTPTFVLTFPNTVNLEEAGNVYFTFEQVGRKITKTGEDLTISGNTVTVSFTQSETAMMSVGQASLQLNWTYSDQSRACSNIVNIEVTKNLLNEVLS